MKDEMAKADSVFFQPVFQEGEIKFGHIFVEKNRKFFSLNDLLIEKQYAIECERNEFERSKISSCFSRLLREILKISIFLSYYSLKTFKIENMRRVDSISISPYISSIWFLLRSTRVTYFIMFFTDIIPSLVEGFRKEFTFDQEVSISVDLRSRVCPRIKCGR